MVQSVTYQSEKQSVYFQGKLIVLENLIPVLSPDEKNKRKREIENHLYDVLHGMEKPIHLKHGTQIRPYSLQ